MVLLGFLFNGCRRQALFLQMAPVRLNRGETFFCAVRQPHICSQRLFALVVKNLSIGIYSKPQRIRKALLLRLRFAILRLAAHNQGDDVLTFTGFFEMLDLFLHIHRSCRTGGTQINQKLGMIQGILQRGTEVSIGR